MKLSAIAYRNIFRNRRRSLLSIISIAVGAMAITFLFAFLQGITADIRTNSWNYDAGEVRLRHADYDRYEHLNPVHYVIPQYRELTARLQQHPAVRAVSPRIRVPSVAFRNEQHITAQGLGLDMNLEPQYQKLTPLIVAGRLPRSNSAEAAMGVALADELGVELGDQATFMTQTRYRSSNAFTVDVVGLANFPVGAMNNNAYILPLESAAHYMRMGDSAGEILLKTSTNQPRALSSELNQMLTDEPYDTVHAMPWQEISPGYSYLQMANVVYSLIAVLFLLLAATVVISTTMMVVHERTKEIGTLAALGMEKNQLVRLFFLEAAYLGLAGAAIGVLIGCAGTLPLSIYGIDFGAAIDMVDMNISTVIHPVLNLQSTLLPFLYASIIAMAATYLPARRAAKLRPVEALRAE